MSTAKKSKNAKEANTFAHQTVTAVKQNKFQQNLSMSHDSIREKNSAFIADDTSDASKNFLQRKYSERRTLERQVSKLTNLHTSSTTTVNVVDNDYDAEQWVEDMNMLQYKLSILNAKIVIAEATDKEWF